MHGEENTIDTMWLDGFPWPVVGAMTRASRGVRLGQVDLKDAFQQTSKLLFWYLRVVSLDRAVFANRAGFKIAMIARLIASKAISPSTGVMDVPLASLH